MSPTYLDWAATAPPHPEVLRTMSDTAARVFGNPSAIHGAGRGAALLLEECRQRLAALLGCAAEEVVFTSGATEANNMVLFSLLGREGRSGHKDGGWRGGSRPEGGSGRRRIVIGGLEHASVYQPARRLEALGWKLEIVPARAGGRVDPQEMAALLDRDTVLVCLMLVSNETGALQPVAELGRLIERHRRESGRRVHFHTDAVQAFGKLPVQPGELGVDSLAISAHKIGGPRGVGALYLRRPAQDGAAASTSFLYGGGEQEGGRRPGTENLPGIHGFVAAAEKTLAAMRGARRQAEQRMAGLMAGLRQVPGVVLIPADRADRDAGFSPYILTAAFPPVPGEVLVRVLEEEGYLISTGSACSSRKKDRFRVHEAMGLTRELAFCAVRISLGPGVSAAQLAGFTQALRLRLPQLLRVAAGQSGHRG